MQLTRIWRLVLVALAGLTAVLPTGYLLADPPMLVRYQARLTDASGVVLTGLHDLGFSIYDQEAGGTLLWSEGPRSLSLGAETVDLLLGEVTPITSGVLLASVRWLEVTVDGSVLVPRQRLVSVPYALASDRLGTMTLTDVQADVDSRIASHAGGASAHHARTTSASELTDGLLDPARLADGSISAAKIIDGAGNLLDSDLLDGLEAAVILERANHTGLQPPATISPQGAASGLDADSVDGIQASAMGRYLDGTMVEATTTGTQNLPNQPPLARAKEFSPLPRGGVVSVRVTTGGPANFVDWQVHINDVPVGSLHTIPEGSPPETETGISVQIGDRLQVYGAKASGGGGTARIDLVELLVANPTLLQEIQ